MGTKHIMKWAEKHGKHPQYGVCGEQVKRGVYNYLSFQFVKYLFISLRVCVYMRVGERAEREERESSSAGCGERNSRLIPLP